MEKYLQQLIEDLRAIAERAPEPDDPFEDDIDIDDHLNSVEEYLNGKADPLSQMVGIEQYQLPPVEMLTPDQARRLYRELVRMLQAKHFYPDFPGRLPVRIKYKILRDNWDREHVSLDFGEVHLDFCSFNPDSCSFPKQYCDCRKHKQKAHQKNPRKRKK